MLWLESTGQIDRCPSYIKNIRKVAFKKNIACIILIFWVHALCWNSVCVFYWWIPGHLWKYLCGIKVILFKNQNLPPSYKCSKHNLACCFIVQSIFYITVSHILSQHCVSGLFVNRLATISITSETLSLECRVPMAITWPTKNSYDGLPKHGADHHTQPCSMEQKEGMPIVYQQ